MAKILMGLVVTAWITYGLLQYTIANRIESTRPYFEQQIKHYMEVSNAASIIATSTSVQDVQNAKERFRQLSNGPMIILGDETVTWSIALFTTCMEDPEHEKCKDRDLPTISVGLSKAMRNTL